MSDYATTGDGLVAALQLLSVVKRQERPVSEVCHCFEPLPQILKNVRYRSGEPLSADRSSPPSRRRASASAIPAASSSARRAPRR